MSQGSATTHAPVRGERQYRPRLEKRIPHKFGSGSQPIFTHSAASIKIANEAANQTLTFPSQKKWNFESSLPCESKYSNK